MINEIANELLEKDSHLKKLVKLLVEEFKPDRIYLFGSKARGDDTSDSDYDIMVVLPKSRLKADKRERVRHRYTGTWKATDILLYPTEKFDARLHLKASLPAVIADEGKLLYAA